VRSAAKGRSERASEGKGRSCARRVCGYEERVGHGCEQERTRGHFRPERRGGSQVRSSSERGQASCLAEAPLEERRHAHEAPEARALSLRLHTCSVALALLRAHNRAPHGRHATGESAAAASLGLSSERYKLTRCLREHASSPQLLRNGSDRLLPLLEHHARGGFATNGCGHLVVRGRSFLQEV